nr:VanZ family protein [Aridibaculum aurantiacum]
MVALLNLTISKNFGSPNPESPISKVNLVPLVRVYERYIYAKDNADVSHMHTLLQDVIGNMILFLPLGLLLPVLFKRLRKFWIIIMLAACLSTFIEVYQFFLRYAHIYRFSDIDDIFWNITGACIGYKLFKLVGKRNAATMPG